MSEVTRNGGAHPANGQDQGPYGGPASALVLPGRWRALGLPVDAVGMPEALAWAAAAIDTGRGGWVATPNPEITVRAWHDPRIAELMSRADLALADGIGMLWASRVLRGPLCERVTGIGFLEGCLEFCAQRDWPVFLLGANPGVAERAASRLVQRMPGLRIAGVHHGYFSEDAGGAVFDTIRQSMPRLVAVGMGHPWQEAWLATHMPFLPGVLGVACGGSLDVLAGDVARAPAWVQRLGFEWLYRLAHAPRARLRRVGALPAFAARVVRLRMGWPMR